MIPVTIESANTAYAPANPDIPDDSQRTPAQTFAEYIAKLPEWERDLIKGNREVKSDYHQSLSQYLLSMSWRTDSCLPPQKMRVGRWMIF
jgi:hypothetical protein